MTYIVHANLSNGLTLTVEFLSKANAERSVPHLIADYAAEGVTASVTITEKE